MILESAHPNYRCWPTRLLRPNGLDPLLQNHKSCFGAISLLWICSSEWRECDSSLPTALFPYFFHTPLNLTETSWTKLSRTNRCQVTPPPHHHHHHYIQKSEPRRGQKGDWAGFICFTSEMKIESPRIPLCTVSPRGWWELSVISERALSSQSLLNHITRGKIHGSHSRLKLKNEKDRGKKARVHSHCHVILIHANTLLKCLAMRWVSVCVRGREEEGDREAEEKPDVEISQRTQTPHQATNTPALFFQTGRAVVYQWP